MLVYRLLGPLTVERDGVELDLGTPKQRAVLAVLLQAAGTPVGSERLLGAVWGDSPPASAANSLQANISRLRKVLRADPSAPSPIVRRGAGYRLDADTATVDLDRFGTAAAAATTAVQRRDWPAAAAAAESALQWWRGEYLADFGDEEWVRVAAVAMRERRAGAVQDLVVGLLGVGDLSGALATSTAMVGDQPLGERATWLHMVALHRAGRSGDALEVFRAYAERLGEELGLDAGPALRDLQGAILRRDDELLTWPAAPAGPGAASVPVPGVIEPGIAPSPPPSAAPPWEPLIGRAAPTAVIRSRFEAARAQGAVWVVIAGPAGIGKTRLADAAAADWAVDGRVARGQCPDLDGVPAWWPIRQVLRDLGADPDVVLTPAPGTEPDAARFAVAEQVAATIRAASVAAPLLIVLEDVHWADQSTLMLLNVLAETVVLAGLSVVLTTRRTADRPSWRSLLDVLARRPGNRRLDLDPFGPAEVAALLHSITGEHPGPADVAALLARTGGNPFYVTEYARLPAEQRQGARIPPAVRTVLRRRFARLPPEVAHTLQVAAVLGEPMDVGLIAAVLSTTATAVADTLDAAADSEIVTGTPDGSAYMFTHALLQDELAAGAPEMRRQRWHLAAADALQDVIGPQALYRRARHLRAAGPWADPYVAVEVFAAAAAAADARWSSDTAALWWEAAVEAHDRSAAPDPDRREHLVAAWLRAMAWAGRYQGVLDALDTALIDALREGRTASVGRLAANLLRVSGSWPWPVYGSDAAPLMRTLRGLDPALHGDPGARARVLAALAIGECYHPDPEVPNRLSRRAMDLADALGNADVVADALLGRTLTYAGVASHAEESIVLLDRLADLDHAQSAGDAVLRHNLLTMATLNLGRVQECAAHVSAGALGADVHRMPVSRVQLRWAEAGLAQWSGDHDRARELYSRAEKAHRSTDLQQAGTFEIADLVMRWDQGRLGESDGAVPTNPLMSRWTEVAAAAAAGRPGCDDALTAEVTRSEPEVWTSLGRWTLLAHCAADRGLVGLVPPLLTALEPVRHCLAAFGQVGVIGPVALAIARLYRLDGQSDLARECLAEATAVAAAADGRVALLRCRAEAAAWDLADAAPTADRDRLRREVEHVAAEADRLGLTGIAARLRALF